MPRKSLHAEVQINDSKRVYGACQDSRGPFKFTKIASPKHKPKNYQYWTLQDLLAYLSCLIHFKQLLMDGGKPCWKVFKCMSALRPHLNPNQCRIHHKKMMDEHSGAEEILLHFEDTINAHSTAVLSLRRQLREIQAAKIAQEVEIKPKDQREMGINFTSNNFFCPFSSDFKQQKDDNIRTDISYLGDYSEKQAIKSGSSLNSYNSLMMQPEVWLGLSQRAKGKEKQWRQCQQLFLAWINKLHFLMQ